MICDDSIFVRKKQTSKNKNIEHKSNATRQTDTDKCTIKETSITSKFSKY